nr:MAG TPA: hypothetical protein [Caudoviricetes sp.]
MSTSILALRNFLFAFDVIILAHTNKEVNRNISKYKNFFS